MKLKIQRITKEEYNNVYNNYKKTSKGINQLKNLKRLITSGIMSIILGTILVLFNHFNDKNSVDYVIGVILLICGFIYLIGYVIIKRNSLNNYLIKNKDSLNAK